LLRTFEGHTSPVLLVAFSPDSARVLSLSDDQTLRLWDAATGQLVRIFQGYTATFSPEGARVLSGDIDRTLKLWDAGTGRLLHTFEGHTDVVYSVAFSPDGT